MPDPSLPMQNALVEGRFGLGVGDTLADPDRDPDVLSPAPGSQLEFTPASPVIKAVLGPGEEDKLVLGLHSIIAEFDSEGYVVHRGARGVVVPDLGGDGVNPVIPRNQTAWTVTGILKFDVDGTGKLVAVKFPKMTINPVAGEVNNLWKWVQLQTGSGTPIIEGRPGPEGPEGPQGPAGAPGGSDAATAEWVETGPLTKAALSATIEATRNVPGRGRIAIELDDARTEHFTEILPMAIRHGVPFGTAWPAGFGNAELVAEAYAAGWEVLSHGFNHEDMSTLTEAQLRTMAEQSVAAIAAITGRPDDIAIVYPEHHRNALSDRVLSEYFTRGRGRQAWEPVPRGGATAWLVPAAFLDVEFDGAGGLSKRVVETLHQIASTDGQMLFYAHYNDTEQPAAQVASLEAMVVLAKALGIQIVRPSEITGSRLATPDPFLTDNTGHPWTLDPGWTLEASGGLHGGQSLRFTGNAPGGGFRSGIARRAKSLPHFATAGAFTLYRASCRYTATAPILFAQGLSFRISGNFRPISGGDPEEMGGWLAEFGAKAFADEVPAPAATHEPITRILAVGPDVATLSNWGPAVISMAEGSVPISLTDIRLERIDVASSLSFTATLAGTTGVTIRTGIYSVERYGISVTPLASTAGRVYATPGANGTDTVVVRSTDAGDTTQQVRVTITPTSSYSMP